MRIHIQVDLFAGVGGEHFWQVSIPGQALFPPGAQDFPADAFLEIRDTIGFAKLHGCKEALTTVHFEGSNPFCAAMAMAAARESTPQLIVYAGQVRLDRAFADAQADGDLLAAFPLRHPAQHFQLPVGET